MQNTDDYLMGQFQNGDRVAFTHLVHRHKQNVFRFVLSRVKNRELASDLTQDVFVKVYKSAKLYQQTGKFRSWLFRMAQNICIDSYRKQQKASILSLHSKSETDDDLTLIDQIEDETANPEQETEFIELQDVIERAFDSLPEKQRSALVLWQYHGMSYSEIASIQKVPVGTVKSRIHNALIKVRDFLKEHDFISET
ncbi:MAG: sigma-70 family RNA polymerase sigma factor [bacterium]|nr:MAG: sigma-70 family RNA polymerase sigma factor [bacterium]